MNLFLGFLVSLGEGSFGHFETRPFFEGLSMSWFLRVLFLAFLGVSSVLVLASENSKAPSAVTLDASESAIKEKAKKRLYPGGRDEDSLQVQAQLPAPLKPGVVIEPEEPQVDHD